MGLSKGIKIGAVTIAAVTSVMSGSAAVVAAKSMSVCNSVKSYFSELIHEKDGNEDIEANANVSAPTENGTDAEEKEVAANDVTESGNTDIGASEEKEIYCILKAVGDKVYICDKNGEEFAPTDIPLEYLPESDREKLYAGVTAYSREELIKYLEDLSN